MINDLLIKSIQIFLVRGFGGSAAFLVTLAVSNMLSVSEAGIVLFAIGVIASLGQVMTLGTSEVILKFVSGYYKKSWFKVNNVFSSLLKMVVFFGIGVAIFGAIFRDYISVYFFHSLDLSAYFILVPVGILAMSLVLTTSSAILGLQKTFLASIFQSCLVPVLFLLLCFLLPNVKTHVDSLDLTIAYVSSVFLVSAIVLFVWFNNKNVKFVARSKLSADVWSSTKPLFVVMIMQVFTMYAGQYATAFLLSSSDIALFSAAQRTAMLVALTLNAVNLVIAPRISLASHKNEKLDILALKSSQLMLTLASPIIIVFICYSELIMSLFGNEFTAASGILVILSVGQFVNVATGSVGYLLMMTNHETDYRNVIIVSGTFTLMVSFLLTYFSGLYGAAIATALGLSMQNLLAAYFVKLRLGFNTLNVFRKVK
ncbi:polysaccharide biosynthesis C-terminal domain-containing protein [Vibrio galatheae]|uniref:polysaccharide biosynthesis C-terminal domain-containing protein n=1 Tax=Vibrio galatheae TaxID=579748 RepID=UPI000696114B|nr:polysaccharide biosynthesis C-terminal domain-containing protein [Vibrio galatheae]